MKIDEGLAALELEPNVPNVKGCMHPVLVWDEREAVLIDTGLPGQEKTIFELMVREGVDPERLTKIIITHQDMDHIGGLAGIAGTLNGRRQAGSRIEVLSHEIEKPYIQGDLMPIKFTKEMIEKLNKQLAELPEDQRSGYKSMFSDNKPEVTDTLAHNQELDCCGGITVIHTPGHTTGHICLYLKKYKTLIAGDALNNFDSELSGPNPVYTYDMKQAHESLSLLKVYDIQRVVCYHGGLNDKSVNAKIAELAK